MDDYDDDFKGILKEIGERDDFKEIDTVEVRAHLLLSSTYGGRLLSYYFPTALPGRLSLSVDEMHPSICHYVIASLPISWGGIRAAFSRSCVLRIYYWLVVLGPIF